MAKRAKGGAKPMRVWVVIDREGDICSCSPTRVGATKAARSWNDDDYTRGYAPYRVVEFREFRPRAKRKGKK